MDHTSLYLTQVALFIITILFLGLAAVFVVCLRRLRCHMDILALTISMLQCRADDDNRPTILASSSLADAEFLAQLGITTREKKGFN